LLYGRGAVMFDTPRVDQGQWCAVRARSNGS